MDSPTLALTKQLIAKQSVTPMDEGCQVLMIEHLQKIGFEVESLRFGDVDNFWAIKGDAGPTSVLCRPYRCSSHWTGDTTGSRHPLTQA